MGKMLHAINQGLDQVFGFLLQRHLRVVGTVTALAMLLVGVANCRYLAMDNLPNGQNPSVFCLIVLGAGVLAMIAWIAFLIFVASWARINMDVVEKNNDNMVATIQSLLFCCWPLILAFCCTAFLFFDTDKEQWVVDGKIGTQRSVFVIPFASDAKRISLLQNVSVEVIATTKSGAHVRAHLYAELKLTSDEATILRIAQQWVTPNHEIHHEIKRELQKQFQAVALKHELQNIDDLVVDWETGSAIGEEFLRSHGLEWAGTLSVSNIQAYFAKDV